MMTGEPDAFDIVIVGAGLAGLTLARALSVCGPELFRIAVVERGAVSGAASDARAFAIAAGPRRMLERLGIWRHIADVGEPVTTIDIADPDPRSPLRQTLLHYDNIITGDEPATHIVEHHDIKRAVVTEARGDSAITLIEGAAIRSWTREPGTLALDLGDRGTLATRLLVGADGRRSRVRDLAGIKTVGWGYGQRGIVTTVAHERPHGGRAMQHFFPAGPFAILPLKGNRSSLVWSEEAGEARRIMALDDAEFLVELRQRFGEMLGEVTLEGERASWPLEMHLARRFVADRVALVGDSAHGAHPIAGQGLNIGLRDVAALSETLIEARRLGLDIGSGTGLERYERWRRFDSTVSAFSYDAINRLFSNANPVLRAARDFGLGLVDRSATLKDFFVREAAGLNGELPKLLRGEPI